jgi:hypothetical protein
MTDAFNPGFFCVDNWFALRYLRVVGPGPAAVYLVLRLHADRAGRCWPSQQLLAELTGLGLRTVQLHLRRLEREGLLRIEAKRREKGGASFIYNLLTPQSDLDTLAPKPPPAGSSKGAEPAPGRQRLGADAAQFGRRMRPNLGADSAQVNLGGEPDPGKGEPPPTISAPKTAEQQRARIAQEASGGPEVDKLALLWESVQTRKVAGLAVDPAAVVKADMANLLQLGIPAAMMRDLILRKSRDRGEYWSTFRARCKMALVSGPRYQLDQYRKASPATVAGDEPARATVNQVAGNLATVLDAGRVQ